MIKIEERDVEIIRRRFLKRYDKAVTELNYKNSFELIIAVSLSAQCTDKRVNIITPRLFKEYPNAKSLAIANLDEIKNIIKSCSFFNNKAKNLIKMAQTLVEDYNGEVPLDEKELIKLAGVGQKSAHVVLIEYTNANLMAVDTHVFRVSHRLGLSDDITAIKTEETLVKIFKTNLDQLHQGMVLFGRYICKAKAPLCDTKCFVQEFCKSKSGFKAH